MLVVGMFAVLSWDSIISRPARHLGASLHLPVPVPVRTLFFAKIAAVATALSLAVAALHSFAGLVWPIGNCTGSDAQW